MKPRYNLRLQSTKTRVASTNHVPSSTSSSRITKKTAIRRLKPRETEATRRHSLRLSPIIKQVKSRPIIHATPPKWRKVENETPDEPSANNDNNDDYNDLLIRHHRRMLEEQKDRKLYERYVRGQHTLRRLQCRRTHTAHLSEATRNRLVRELERERRYTIHDRICSHLTDHTVMFRHGNQFHSNQPMDWSTLEDELPRTRSHETVRQLDVMINNLKKVIHSCNSPTSKPRLSVHERRKQRLAASGDHPVFSSNAHMPSSSEIHSNLTTMPSPSPVVIFSRLPMVRFLEDQNIQLRTSNSQHLICIQNVLSQNNHHHHSSRLLTNDIPTPVGIRKQFLRSKSLQMNMSEPSQTKKRALEKENCSLVTSTTNQQSHANAVLRPTIPLVSIKSATSYRPYPNTRKHPININSLTTRRQTRLSANV